MKKLALTLSLSSACLLSASNDVLAGNLYITPDISGTAPAISSQEFASASAEILKEHIQDMNFGDKITYKTLGNDKIHHSKSDSLIISKRNRPENAAEKVAARIESLPQSKKGEGSTNILSYFENNRFDCSRDNSAVWLLTDGIENSQDFSATDLLKDKKLPEPFEQTLEGCAVVMIGVGRLADGNKLPRKQIQILKKTWTEWLTKAGAVSVDIRVNP
jgi:hypothetical protein